MAIEETERGLDIIPNVRMADLSPEYSEIMTLGRVLHASGYFRDVKDQAQAVTKILFGRELGFSPIVSMSGVYIIEGKPAISANLLAACIKRSGKYDYRITAWDSERCEIMFKQKIGEVWEDLGPSSFTKEDATRAGVWGKNTWGKYPKAMLFARALSQGERAYCPDVSSCALYVPEELGANVNESGEVLTAQDLPKSARPVERTTEDIPLKPKVEAGPLASTAMVLGHEVSVEPPQSVDPPVAVPARNTNQHDDNRHYDEPIESVWDATKRKVAEMQSAPVDEPVYPGCIDKGMKANFARSWSQAAPKGMKAAEVERARKEWLARHNYVGDDGVGTAGKIPLKDFDAVKADAVAFLKGLK